MGLSRNKVAVSEGAAGSPPFYGESGRSREARAEGEEFEEDCCSIFRDRAKESVIITQRVHPYPFRTRKLSSAVPIVLYWRRCGRVGRGRHRDLRRLRAHGGVAQMGEHLPCKQGVMGSNPIISTSFAGRRSGQGGMRNTGKRKRAHSSAG